MEAGKPPLPRIDLNDGKQRTAFMLFATGTLLLMIFTAIGGYRAFDITESVSFCGKVCHTVMNPEYTTYLHSPHARVACVQCHVGPGCKLVRQIEAFRRVPGLFCNLSQISSADSNADKKFASCKRDLRAMSLATIIRRRAQNYKSIFLRRFCEHSVDNGYAY